MSSLNITSDFTIEDIHKIREYNYQITKEMTLNERIDYYKNRSNITTQAIEEIRKAKNLVLTK